MKTITEFSGFQLSAALKTSKELTTAGKTAEETSQALAEAYKLEGDKLKHFTAALEVAKTRSDHLKRVIAFSIAEGEKAPAGSVEKEGTHYISEFFYVPETKKPHGGRDGKKFGGKGGRGGKGKGKGGGRGGDRDGRGGGGGRGGPKDKDAKGGSGDNRFARGKKGPAPKGKAPAKPASEGAASS